jgi:hypothetical protein
VVVLRHSLKDPLCQPIRRRLRLDGQGPEVITGGAKHRTDCAPAIIDAGEDGLGQLHEAPHQLDGEIRSGCRHLLDDHAARHIKVTYEFRATLPMHVGLRITQAVDPLGDLRRDLLASFLARQFQTESTFDRSLLGREIEQNGSQT